MRSSNTEDYGPPKDDSQSTQSPNNTNPSLTSSAVLTTNPPSTTTTTQAMESKKKSTPLGSIIGGTIGGLAFAYLSLLTFIFLRRRTKHDAVPIDTDNTPELVFTSNLPGAKEAANVCPATQPEILSPGRDPRAEAEFDNAGIGSRDGEVHGSHWIVEMEGTAVDEYAGRK